VKNHFVDLGAAFISEFYKETRRLVDETGLTNALTKRSQTAYIVRDMHVNELWPLDQLLKSAALSPWGRLRLLGLLPPLILHWGQLDITRLEKIALFDRETAAQLSKRQIGTEATEYFFDPLLRGLMYWDAQTTSAAVVLCILKSFGTSKGTYRFAQGMSQFASALSANLTTFYDHDVQRIERDLNDKFTIIVETATGEQIFNARSVICATPAPATHAMLPWLPKPAASFLRSVTYSKTTIVTFAVPASAKDYPQGAILFPATVPDLSSINPLYQYVDRLPSESGENERLLNVYLSSRGSDETTTLPDAELADLVLRRVDKLVNSPAWAKSAVVQHVHRWPLAIPRFTVGHVANVSKFKVATQESPGIAFAGDYLTGPYIDGAVRSGLQAAGDASRYLSSVRRSNVAK
jgi:oxygen-dependent protoporphyrinogen oxidase